MRIPEGTTDPKNDSKTSSLLFWNTDDRLLKISTAAGWVTPGIVDGTIGNADISGSAAIGWRKVSKSGAVPRDVGAAAASHSHAGGDITSGTISDDRLSSSISKLGSSIESSEITDGTIANADISGSAAIATSKLSGAVTSITGNGLGGLATLGAV